MDNFITDMHWVDAIILGHAIGDALGVPAEFKCRTQLASKPITDYQGFGSHHVPAGTWSDDTSMTLATLDSLANGLDYRDIIQKFCDWEQKAHYTATDRVFDIGGATSQALHRFISGTEPLKCGGAQENDNGNGSLMRILPVAIYCKYTFGEVDMDTPISIIHNVSSLTHRHPCSQIGCGIYSMVLSRLLDDHKKESIQQGLRESWSYYSRIPGYQKELIRYARIFSPDFAGTPEAEIKSSGYVVDTLEAAIWCVLNTNSYVDAVLKAVNLGSDTDTVAAVTGGLAGAIYGLNGIPEKWKNGLLKKEELLRYCSNFEETIHFFPIRVPIISDGADYYGFSFETVQVDPELSDWECQMRRSKDSFCVGEAAFASLMGFFAEKYFDKQNPCNITRNNVYQEGDPCFLWGNANNFFTYDTVTEMCKEMLHIADCILESHYHPDLNQIKAYFSCRTGNFDTETAVDILPMPGKTIANFYQRLASEITRLIECYPENNMLLIY